MDFELVTAQDLAKRRWLGHAVVVAMPCTDEAAARRAGEHAASRAGCEGLVLAVLDEQRQGFVATANQAFAACQGEWFGYMAQDAFAGRLWLQRGLQALHERAGVLLAFNDGKWAGGLASFGLASRAWAGKNYPGGTLFFPGYRSHYGDTELTVLALSGSGLVYEPDSVLVELDWGKDGAGVDPHDRALFRWRRDQGFGGRVGQPELLARFG